MSFDPISYAMAKSYSDSKGGYTEPGTVFTWDGDTSKTEIISEVIRAIKVSDEFFDLNAVESVTLKSTQDGSTRLLTASAWTIDNQNGVLSIICTEIDNYLVASFPMTFEGVANKGTYIIVQDHPDHAHLYVEKVTFAPTIVPIKPEYLPEEVKPVVVDFDELGITAYILELFNTGGGDVLLGNGDIGSAEPFCRAFPENGDYVAKLTIPGTGTYYVNPVYTLYNEEGFQQAHFDCYIFTSTDQFTKFYVKTRLAHTTDGGVVVNDWFEVRVGFH